MSFSLSLSSPLQGCEVFGQAHGPGYGQEGESHHTVCHGDGQVARLCQNSLWNLQARFWRKGTLAPTLHHLIRKLNASSCVIVRTSNWKRRNSKTSFLYTHTPPPPRLSGWRCQADASAEYRRQEGTKRKCVFCYIFFFSHAAKCRGSEARFNHWSVEQCSSLRQDPEAPLAVQIC